MATLPDPVPPWADTYFGRDKEAWRLAKRQCRDMLVFWAREGRFGTYGELCRRVTAIDWPKGPDTREGRQISLLLSQVALGELAPDEDRPLLSSLCVMESGEYEGLPSDGFWTLCNELNLHVGESKLARERFWVHEFTRCLKRWVSG
jgi:hypothetical protein